MYEILKWLSRARIELLFFLAGFAFLLAGTLDQFPTLESSWSLLVRAKPLLWALILGFVLMLIGVGVWLLQQRTAASRAQDSSGIPASKSARTPIPIDEFSDLINRAPSSPLDDYVAPIDKQEEERRQRLEQRERAIRRERDHQLVQLVSEAQIEPGSANYDQRIDDRFLAIGSTSKAILKTLYKHTPEQELPSDELYTRHNAKDIKHPVQNASEMYHRLMMLAFLSLVEVRATGPRNTVIKKIPDVYRVLTSRKRLDS